MFTMALFSEMRKVLAASAVFVMGLVLTACSSGDADDTVSSSPVATVDTEHSSTQSAPDELEESTTQAPSAVPEEETASSPSSESQMKQDFISALDSMGEEDALMYTGNGSGPLAGTRFQTADGTVHCQIAATAVACAVPEKTEDWPEDMRAGGSNVGSSAPADTVGWSEMVDVPLSEEPMNWQQQDDFPYIDTGTELPDQYKLIVSTGWEDSSNEAICGVDGDTVICTLEDHGFAVSQSLYETW